MSESPSSLFFGVSLTLFVMIKSLHEGNRRVLEIDERVQRLSQSSDKDVSIRDFKIAISDEQLSDLRSRLQLALFPEAGPRKGDRNELGIESSDLKAVVDYWRDQFDWRAQESLLNQLPQYTTEIDGVTLHFIHAKACASKYPKALPLMLVHGWPSTAFDFRHLIPLLVDPLSHGGKAEDAFHVVVPNMPGYAFSSRPALPKSGAKQVAALYSKLMRRIGYSQYLVNGGDWGSVIVPELAVYEEALLRRDRKSDPSVKPRLLAMHINGAVSTPPLSLNPFVTLHTALSLLFPKWFFDEFDLAKLQLMGQIPHEVSYFLQQVTKPNTIGVALQNSPVAVAAWLTEKYISWTDCAISRDFASRPDHARLTPVKASNLDDKVDLSLHTLSLSIPLDDLLTTISLYWFTQCIASSVMMYHNTVNLETAAIELMNLRTDVPCAIADFPVDIIWSPISWAKHTYTNIIQYSRMKSGGHFAALEEPYLLAEDLRRFKAKSNSI